MPSPRLHRLLLFLAPILALYSTATAAPPPVSAFVKWPEVSQVRISEDGRYVSFLTPNSRRYFDLNLYDQQTKESKKFDFRGDDVLSARWIDATRLLLTTYNEQTRTQEVIFDATAFKVSAYISLKQQFGYVVSSLRRDPNLFIVRFFEEGHSSAGRGGLALINTKLRPANISGIKDHRYNVKEWLVLPRGEHHETFTDKDGEVRLVTVYENKRLQFHYRPSATSPWQELPLDSDVTDIVGFDDDPDYLYLSQYAKDAQSSRLHRYRVSTNDLGPPLFDDPNYSMSGAGLFRVRQKDGKDRTLALSYDRDVPVQRAIDPLFATVQMAVNAQLPGRLNLIADCDDNLRYFVVASLSGREPARFVVYDHQTKDLMALPAPTPWFDPAGMSVQRPIKFTARDGLVLEGYLSLPAPRPDGSKAPLVVLPHGGPWVRDTWGYSNDVQFLTSRGYAVFQPNYRGSIGYSRAVSKVDDFAFRKMHDDVTDGVKYLVAQGIVDSKRIAIFGGSFGGYLAVAGVAFEPDLYRCAVTFAGVFDWKQLVRQQWADSDTDQFNYDLLVKKLGDPATQQAHFDEMSPIRHVAAIKAPIFVVHGKLDRTVDYRQSTRLLAELDAHKIPHEQLFFETEFHGFSERKNYEKFLTALERFLAKNL